MIWSIFGAERRKKEIFTEDDFLTACRKTTESMVKSFPPPLYFARAPAMEAKRYEMLLACLRGGMSYEDAKAACSKEWDAEIQRVSDMDERCMAAYTVSLEKWNAENKGDAD